MPGHPHDLSDEQAETIRKRRAEGGTLEQIAAELKVHHSTVARYVQETEPPKPSDRYSQLVSELRAKAEDNFRETMKAIDKEDWKRLEWLMKARGALTQQARGLLAGRDLYPKAPEQQATGKDAKQEAFLSGLVAEQPSRHKRRKGASGAASHATASSG
jgi:transcriptional regulator with XRE-family HTH domain